jgi:hypothetical protein
VDTPIVTLPSTLEGVVARLRDIDAALPVDDGVGEFNRMYLAVTERIVEVIAQGGEAPVFRDMRVMADLDVRFANLWLAAYDADVARRAVPAAWRPLFEARAGGRLPVQYALAGMNSHIEHDLPVAVVATCQAHRLEPEALHPDYEAVNDVLAQVERPIRRSFLDALGREVDDELGPIAHLISTWNIDSARELSWVTAETLWVLRRTSLLRDRFLDSLSHTVGMTSRALLSPIR